MVFIAVLVGVAVLAGLAVWAFRRRGSDEMHSVAGYQQRLERLEEVRRRQVGSVRIIGGSTPEGDQPTVGEDGRIQITSSPSRRVIDDTNQLPVYAERGAPSNYRRGRDTAIARMSHRPRRLGAPIAAAVAVVILVTGLALAGAHSRTPHSTTTTTTSRTGGAGKKNETTTTTTAKPTTFTATSTSGSDANYQLPFASYTVMFTATTGDCYIEVTNANGQVPYASVLHAGQTQQLTLTGSSRIDLGAPSYAQVQVDRTPVTFPSPVPAPLVLVLNAAPSGSTSSTTTSTT